MSDLTLKDVRIKHGKKELPIKCFGQSDEPLVISILFDSSGSMAGRDSKLTTFIQGLKTFVNSGHELNTYFVATFDVNVDNLVEMTSDRRKVLSAIDSLSFKKTKGNTSAYDAIDQAILKFADIDQKHKVVIVISDGEDNASKTEFSELEDRVREAGVQVFRVDFERLTHEPRDYNGVTRNRRYVGLDRTVEESGGVTYSLTKISDVLESFDLIGGQLRARFIIGFDSPVPPSSKWQKLDVKFKERTSKENVFVKSSSGFYF